MARRVLLQLLRTVIGTREKRTAPQRFRQLCEGFLSCRRGDQPCRFM